MSEQEPRAIPADYDEDPERFRASVRTAEKYCLVADVHESVSERLSGKGLEPVLDLGCGEGRLIRPLRTRGMYVVGFDISPTMLAAVLGPRVRGDAKRLPFTSGSFGSVAALYMLYHFPDPREAIAESHRVLRPGGLFVTSAPSRFDLPELALLLPDSSPMTFDAENGAEMIREYFHDVNVERWDAPLVYLPDRDALVFYLYGRGLTKARADRVARHVSIPLTLTKRGALIFGYKRS